MYWQFFSINQPLRVVDGAARNMAFSLCALGAHAMHRLKYIILPLLAIAASWGGTQAQNVAPKDSQAQRK
jgi:hypothetical protein